MVLLIVYYLDYHLLVLLLIIVMEVAFYLWHLLINKGSHKNIGIPETLCIITTMNGNCSDRKDAAYYTSQHYNYHRIMETLTTSYDDQYD